MKCPECEGSGEVDDDFARRREIGRKMVAARIRKGYNLRDAARALDVSLMTLSSMELGMSEPDPSIYDKLEARR